MRDFTTFLSDSLRDSSLKCFSETYSFEEAAADSSGDTSHECFRHIVLRKLLLLTGPFEGQESQERSWVLSLPADFSTLRRFFSWRRAETKRSKVQVVQCRCNAASPKKPEMEKMKVQVARCNVNTASPRQTWHTRMKSNQPGP